MRTMMYDNEIYWKCTDFSAIRPHGKDRVKILNIHKDGSITVRQRTVKPWIREAAEHEFRKGGLMA